MTIMTPPFVIVILFAIIAWALTQGFNYLQNQPMIKVQTITKGSKENKNGDLDIELSFKNITGDKNFNDVEIQLMGNDLNNKFSEPDLRQTAVGIGATAKLYRMKDGIIITLPKFFSRPGNTIKNQNVGRWKA